MKRLLPTLTAACFTLAALSGCEPHQQTPGEQLDSVIDEVQEAGDEFTSEAKEATNQIGDAMKTDDEKTIGETIDAGLEKAGEALDDARKTGTDAAAEALDATGQQLEKSGNKLQNSAGDAGQAIDDGVQRVGKQLEKVGESVKDAVSPESSE